MERVIAYVDGFNLYFGMKSRGWSRYYWLNVERLARSLLKPGQRLELTRYFTSRVLSTPSDPAKHRRQNAYLEALATLPELHMYFGRYQKRPMTCRNCGARWQQYDEKMTDVNLGVQLVIDAFQDNMDTALLVSGDGDLTGVIRTVRQLFPEKRVVVAFPPRRYHSEVAQVAAASFMIGRDKLAASQFPNRVVKADGHQLHRPTSWR